MVRLAATAAAAALAALPVATAFSSPTSELPDVVLSESYVAKAEGTSFSYTVRLTHAPGMREDGTIDLLNDEVRIYLTSSQEVLQQDDVAGAKAWQQRRNHRTQLQIATNDITSSGTAGAVTGPLPYVYVAYSTVNPEHASPIDGTNYEMVCPLPTHPAYAELTSALITGTDIAAAGGEEQFAGCYQIQYNGFAPVLDSCAATPTDLVTSCDDAHEAAWPDSGAHYGRTGATTAYSTATNKPACVANLPAACANVAVAGFDGVAGLLAAKEAGGEGAVPLNNPTTSTANTVSGDSDYRIYSDGAPVVRDVVEASDFCRYCAAPGLYCDAAGTVGPGTGCNVVTVNGGDQQPEEQNWLYPAYASGPSWRGDLSSSAQLIFDSTNWQVPQTVQVTLREDDVFEPEVHLRGQDALVHHYVVAQDINLQHTYYEDINVNDLVVSITDNDPAILIESNKVLSVTEEPTANNYISYRLASEPMYDVTVYLQSGEFFDPAQTPTVDTALPDDEQLIFQDDTQYNTCFHHSTGALLDCTDANARPSCANNGQFVTLVSGASALPTGPVAPTECARFTVQNRCEAQAASGCEWAGGACAAAAAGAPYTAKDITCSGLAQAACEAYDGCSWDSACTNIKYGYDCRSYMFFTTTNWDVFQKMKVIGVPDYVDELLTETRIGVLMESRDWYYNSPGSRLIGQNKANYQPLINEVLWGTQYLTSAACTDRDNTATAAADKIEPVTCTWTSGACTCTVDRSIFDTRKGVHIPRYVTTFRDSDLYGVTAAIAASAPRLTAGAYQGAYHELDANNGAACCQLPADGSVRTIDGIVYDPDDLTQVVAFDPSQYANNNVHLGAVVHLSESTSSPGKGVTISRTSCEATEGRRYWFDQFVAQADPITTGLSTTYGLFTTDGTIANTADGSSTFVSAVSSDHPTGDRWTMEDIDASAGGHAGMTAPVCPYTIVLDSSPAEGRTAVISLREDVELSTLRDHELYFYEEPSYRGPEIDQTACAAIGGSDWLADTDLTAGGACFINNVPCFAAGTTNFAHSGRRVNSAGDVSCADGDTILARGSTDLDVMFTANDWNVPRRITAIALNDDVDEPTEIRTIYHSVTACEGYNHNTLADPATASACVADSTYTNEVPAASVDVRVVDDDIADLVVICGDGYTSGGAATVDEAFVGSYDSSGPSAGTWYENIERAGPNAEDGISGSEFGGSINLVGGSQTTSYSGQGTSAGDGIGGGGHSGSAGAAANGYLTDLDDPLCAGFAGNPTHANSNPSPKCFNPADVADHNGPWTHYDPFYDRYVVGGTLYSSFARDTYDGTPVTIAQHNRGFKGVGPAPTEPEDEFACTIHSRECLNDVVGDADDGVDSANAACVYGTFQVRLNSSPGTKHVRRQYVGETGTTIDEELVYIVISPDATAQTTFDPPAVTFTHTGGVVGGQDTYRWDEPVTIKVVPVDDFVDERAGVIIDYTSFTITQSHFGEAYWTYTTPYQTSAAVGSMKIANDGSTGRADTHTPFRHHIRTIHTADNDFAGVRLESRTVSQAVEASNANQFSHSTVALTATEGGTFAFYSIRLDTQPRKPQRQAGTNPNTEITNAGSCDVTTDITSAGTSTVGAYTVAGYDDYSSYTRPNACGSIEHEEEYWVDVTVTQTIQVDLMEPESCPGIASWGGGSSPDHEYLHPRFPYNAKDDGTGYYRPINELTQTANDMDGYLTTCGGWQHDATYRFTSSNWDVPQYVYLYAHNDRDADSVAGRGGNDPASTTTTLKHYVETEDTPENMRRAGYVQRNKHGGVYTQGNLERFPFGVIDNKHNRETGRTTFGYTTYRSLHEFVDPTTRPSCVGIACMGQGSGTLCCTGTGGQPATAMGIVPVRASVNLLLRGSLGLAGYTTAVDQSACAGYALPTDATDLCVEAVTGVSNKQPWKDADGTPCEPLNSAGALCEPTYATSQGGMHFPPNDIVVTVADNDVLVDDSAASAAASSAANCRQTSLLQYTDSAFKISRKECASPAPPHSPRAVLIPAPPAQVADGLELRLRRRWRPARLPRRERRRVGVMLTTSECCAQK